MKILQINTLDLKGGASRVAYELKNELKNKNVYSCIFVCKKYTNDKDIFIISKDTFLGRLFRKLTNKDLNLIIKKIANKITTTDLDFFNNNGLFKSIQYQQSDLIHCHNLHSNYFNLKNLIKISKEKPIIWTLHDMWAITSGCPHAFNGEEKNGFFKCPTENKFEKYLNKIKKEIYEKSNFEIVVPSLWLKEKIEKSVLKEKKCHLIYNGIDNKIFKPYKKNKSRKMLGLPTSKTIITFLANSGKKIDLKGWKYTEKVIQKFKGDESKLFLCIGGDSDEENTKNIKNIPYIKDKETLAKYYSASDIFIFTSTAENFPLVILEAMSCGIPIVSFDVGGVKEAVVHKKNGYIAKYKNSDDIIEGIKYILNLPESEKENMRKNSINTVRENFTVEKMTQKYYEIYKKNINDYVKNKTK